MSKAQCKPVIAAIDILSMLWRMLDKALQITMFTTNGISSIQTTEFYIRRLYFFWNQKVTSDIHYGSSSFWNSNMSDSNGLWLRPIIHTKIACWLWSQSSVLLSASIIKSILVFKSHNRVDAKWSPISFKNFSTANVDVFVEFCSTFLKWYVSQGHQYHLKDLSHF